MIDQAEIEAVGLKLQELLADDEGALLVAIGASQSNPDCEVKSSLVTISATVAGKTEQFSGNGLGLTDSLWIARGKLRQRRELAAKGKGVSGHD